MEIEEKVVRNIKKIDVHGESSPYGKKDWTTFTNGGDMLKELQDNGMFWAEAFKQLSIKSFSNDPKVSELDIFYIFSWFANAIETAKQINHERYKLKVGRNIDEIAQKFGYIKIDYAEDENGNIIERKITNSEFLAAVDKILNV